MRMISTIVTVLVILALPEVLYSQRNTHCDKTFEFLLMEEHNSFCWIGETEHGACQTSKVIQISMDGQEVSATKMDSKTYNDWIWVHRLSESQGIGRDFHKELSADNDFSESMVGLKIRKPSYNSSLYELFVTSAYGQCASQWNNNRALEGMDLPRITADEGNPTLVYYYAEGLYFNYEISKVIYFPDTRYLLIFTQQNQKCGHNAPMHGFMIFQLR